LTAADVNRRFRADRAAHGALKSAAPEPATRSRIVHDTRVSSDDPVPLIVRYAKNACGAATEVPGDPVADRPAPGTTRARVRGARSDVRQTTPAELRLDAGKSARITASAQSIDRFDRLHARMRDLSLSKPPKRATRPHNRPESGECRLRRRAFNPFQAFWREKGV
jgi:hypothetical protein